MFEEGRSYSFVTTDHEGDSTWSAKVIEWAAPLLKVDRLGSYVILNTTSPRFVSAEPDDAAARAVKEERHRAIVEGFTTRFVAPSGE